MKRFRKHVRLSSYDYSTPGGYFVTICTDYMQCLFGEIANGTMRLNDCGTIADQCWKKIPEHFPAAKLGAFQIMPNHIHAVILLQERGHRLGNIVGSYKAAVTKKIRTLPDHSGIVVWERSYHEHVIRNDDSFNRIHQYVVNNPLRWEFDRYHPARNGQEKNDDWLDALEDKA